MELGTFSDESCHGICSCHSHPGLSLHQFISVKIYIPLTTGTTLRRLEELPPPLVVGLMAARLILPEAFFLYAYPFIILVPCCLSVFNRLANGLQSFLSTNVLKG